MFSARFALLAHILFDLGCACHCCCCCSLSLSLLAICWWGGKGRKQQYSNRVAGSVVGERTLEREYLGKNNQTKCLPHTWLRVTFKRRADQTNKCWPILFENNILLVQTVFLGCPTTALSKHWFGYVQIYHGWGKGPTSHKKNPVRARRCGRTNGWESALPNSHFWLSPHPSFQRTACLHIFSSLPSSLANVYYAKNKVHWVHERDRLACREIFQNRCLKECFSPNSVSHWGFLQ